MAVEPLFGTRAQRAFIITIVVFIEAIVVVTMVGLTFGTVRSEAGSHFDGLGYKTLPCYLALFILAEIFEFVMAFDALRLRNIIQLMGIFLFHGALIVSSALQVHETKVAIYGCPTCVSDYVQLWNYVQHFLIVAPCVIAASWFFLMFWFRELYSEFGWVIFHVVGANPKLKSMYQYYQIFICLLKFDFFCFVGVTMQLLIVVLNSSSAEFGVTIAAIPVVLFLLAGCAYAVRNEIKWLMTLSLTLMVAAMTYSLSVQTRALLRAFVRGTICFNSRDVDRLQLYLAVVAFLLLLTTFAIGIKCFRDFDKGLYESKTHDLGANSQYLPSPRTQGGMAEHQSSYFTGGAPLQPQISIE
ncbi:hypothetical protein AZE42_01658 [Rhizopogon vesiculosus]|uniref:TRP C-terminal domain-containing protein n=1 Tax=Rhizopogon vesiculosus TaxID=180088 RepID=A0A1J8RCH7_9AGAM|nr:hypothetical protein AZE42_01658 [Rhizopogon vesiculosus]